MFRRFDPAETPDTHIIAALLLAGYRAADRALVLEPRRPLIACNISTYINSALLLKGTKGHATIQETALHHRHPTHK